MGLLPGPVSKLPLTTHSKASSTGRGQMVLSRWKCVAALAAATSCLLQGGALAEDTTNTACSLLVSPEDAARGLDVVTDAKCASGGDGCIDTICRHCRATNTTAEDVATFPRCLDYVSDDNDLASSADDDGSDGSDGSSDSDSDDGGSGVMDGVPNHLLTDATVSGASYGCPFPTSGGDFAVGIQLVGDTTCSRGGLGCYADVCRFCKFRETPQSGHLLTCVSLGYKVRDPLVVPVLPPVNPATGCPFNVSSGDFAVGVQLVGDPSCGGGGLGCYKNVCRFCKFQETPQSTHWRNCSDFGYPHTPPPPPPPAFVTASLEGDDGEWTGETGCAYAVSTGDFNVGVQLVGDASCAQGGVGCFGSTCRFCQFRGTPQSQHLLKCSQLGYPRSSTQPVAASGDTGIADPVTGCPFPVSPGDFAAGVQLVGDTSCAKGGLGCFKDVCRFCKFKETTQSAHWVPCSDYNYPPVAPPIVQPADINEPPVDFGTGCPYPVSAGDLAAGVQLVGDANCTKGGLGCYKDVCRFCKFQETPQSTNFTTCASLGWPRTVAPVVQPADVVSQDPTTQCPYAVAKGDFDAGIQLVGDASCVKGGLGCYKNVCRFCKFRDSPESANWVPCSDLGYPRNGAVFAPASIDGSDPKTGCPYPVSSGDYDAGVQLVGDSSCTKGGVGCFKDVCRYCKFRATPQSSAYLNCEDLGYFFTSASSALVPKPPCKGPSTKCPFTASASEQAAGVLLVGDATCDKGGVGCYQNVCRYCQLVPTVKSNQFVTCKSLGYDYALPPLLTKPAPTSPPPPPPTTTAPPPPPPPTTAAPTPAPTLPPCPVAVVSTGDYAVGINLVGDPSCAAGGIGCFQNVCRYCSFQNTTQAANFVPCSNFLPQPIAAPADIVDTAPPTTAPPPPPTPPPATLPPVVATVCDSPVSKGDKDAGVALTTDYSCLIRGLGCVQGTVCRFCRAFQSEKSNHLEDCSVYGGAAPSIEAPPPAAVDPSACAARLAIGDTEGGVGAFYDASCSPTGGLGCFGGVCRYCQAFSSDRSKNFVPCPTTAPTPAPAPPAPALSPAGTTAPPAAAPSVASADTTAPAPAPGGVPTVPVASTAAPVATSTDPNAAAPPVAPTNPPVAPSADPNAAAPPVAPVATTGPPVAPSTDPNAAPPAAPVATTGYPPADPNASPTTTTSTTVASSTDPTTTSTDSTTAPPTDPSVAPPATQLRAAASEQVTGFAATEKRLDELLQDSTFRWSMLAAACVGTVAVIAVVVLGAKRVVARRKARAASTRSALDEPAQDVNAQEEREPTPTPAPTGVQEGEV